MSEQAVELFTPYSTVEPMLGAKPSFISAYDASRLRSYQIYEQIYWNVPDTYKLVMYGSDQPPIYIPTARTLIDTTNRYVGRDLGWIVEPGLGAQEEADSLLIAWNSLMRRERFLSLYSATKKLGLIHGDWVMHVLADPAKVQGRRLRLLRVDPGAYYPVTHPDDPDRIIAAYLFETIAEGDKTMIKRQTYTKGADPVNNDGSDTTIYNSVAIFDIEQWEDITSTPVRTIKPPTALPPQITAIPLYHIRNQEEPGNPYGSSEIRGYERIMAAVNQAISDQELALALEGLGMYSTDSGPPVDPETGEPTNWKLGPGKVIERAAGSNFDRVNGVTHLPGIDHLNWLVNQLKESSGLSDAAIGRVDVQVAESGIALYLQLAPLLAKVDEKNQGIDDILSQMFFDIVTGWLPAYEQQTFVNARVLPTFGDAVPENRAGRIKEIIDLYTAKLMDIDTAQGELALLGFTFPDNARQLIVADAAAMAAAADPFAARAAAESEVI